MNSFSKRSVIEGLEKAKATRAKKWRDNLPTWCPGCGHFTALHGLYEAAETLAIPSKDFVLVSGIGCSGRFPFFVKGFGVHALHGRAIPVATGVKIANPELTVIVVGGDGDGVGIGGGHFPHAVRNNFDMTYILLDNSIYGLTKGQISPTSPLGMKSGTSPYGNIAKPLDPATLALVYNATFVARVFSRDREQVKDVITRAISHKGFAFVHDLSPCVEFNKLVTYDSWRERVSYLPDDHSVTDRSAAMTMAGSIDPIYLGVLYDDANTTFEEQVRQIKTQLKKT